MPNWFPWIFVGGIVFMLLSFLASKYQGREHKTKAFAQDFISGAIVITLMGILVPDVFPKMAIPTELPVPTIFGGGGDEVQVGPPPFAKH